MKTSQNRLRVILFVLVGLVIVIILVIALSLGKQPPASSLPNTMMAQMTYEVVNTFPHDPEAFTQGLIYHNGYLYESTGRYGASSLRQIDLETGEILRLVNLSPEYFGEGLTIWEETLLQITWQEGTGFVYDVEDFSLLGTFAYPMEGWGLTHDGEQLILSDGTPTIYFLNPDTFQIMDSIDVSDSGEPVWQINELEYIRGEIFANLWQTDEIIRINPDTGEVTGRIDMEGILPDADRTPTTDVLNGIAYDPEADRLFITGKRWPWLYEVRLIPSTDVP
jgi:glutaminyl-peptide cyclotransferase